MANNASNYYASVGSSIMNNDGSNELSSAVDNSIKTYALNLAQQQEMNNLLDKSVNALTLNEKDANGNYTGFSKIFHDEVARDKANQIDKSAEEVKNRKMQELQNMQNSLLQEQNNLQIDGITKAVTGQNYSDFSNNLNKALEHKYTSAGGNAMSIDTIKYYVQNPNMVLEAEKAHQLAAQNGTVAQTSLKPNDIAGLKAILQDRNLVTLFEKDKYIENERDRLNKGYFTPEENLQRAGMLKQVNEWAYRTNTQQEVANMLDSRAAGIMGRKQGESYEENLDRIINAKNQISLSNAVDRFGNIDNGFPISSDINNNVNTGQSINQQSNSPISETQNFDNTNANQQAKVQPGIRLDNQDDYNNGYIAPLTFKDANGKDINVDVAVNEENFGDNAQTIKNGLENLRIMQQKKDDIVTNHNNDVGMEKNEIAKTRIEKINNARNRYISNGTNPLGKSLSNGIDGFFEDAYNGTINFFKGMKGSKVQEFLADLITEPIVIGTATGVAAGGGLYYGINKFLKTKGIKLPPNPTEAQITEALKQAGLSKEQFLELNKKAQDARLNILQEQVKKGEIKQSELDKYFDKNGNPTKFNNRETLNEFVKKYKRQPTAEELEKLKKAHLEKQKGILSKVKNKALGLGKGALKMGKALGSKGIPVLGAVSSIVTTEAEILDIFTGNGAFRKDLEQTDIDNKNKQLDLTRDVVNKVLNTGTLKINFNDPKMDEPFANVSIDELKSVKDGLIKAKNVRQNASWTDAFSLSPIQDAGRNYNKEEHIANYDNLIGIVDNAIKVKELYYSSDSYKYQDLTNKYNEGKMNVKNLMNNTLRPDYFNQKALSLKEQAANLPMSEQKAKLEREAHNLKILDDKHRQNVKNQNLANTASVFGYNLLDPANKVALASTINVLGRVNDKSASSAMYKKVDGIEDKQIIKIPDTAQYRNSTPLIMIPFVVNNGNSINNIKLFEGTDKILRDDIDKIVIAFNDIVKAAKDNDINSLFRSDGNLYSKYSNFTEAISDSKKFRENFINSKYSEKLDKEARALKIDKSIKNDKILSATLGNTVENLDSIGLYALKAAFYYALNPQADYTDAKTIKGIMDLDIKKAIKERQSLK